MWYQSLLWVLAGSDAAVAAFEGLLPSRADWEKKSARQQGGEACSISKLGGQHSY